jgi:hypothetical protein
MVQVTSTAPAGAPLHFDVAQLFRDAYKAGAYQAKFYLALYLMKVNPAVNHQQNYDLLSTVAASNDSRYTVQAKVVQRSLAGNLSAAEVSAWKPALEKKAIKPKGNLFLTTDMSAEYDYKVARIRMESPDMPYAWSDYIRDLKKIVKSPELTDTLKAKVYFQLMRANLELTSQTGRRCDLQRAAKVARKLTSDPDLKDMFKSFEAARVLVEIDHALKASVLSSSDYFELGFRGSRQFFKYLGLLLGNVLDLSLVFLPKLFFIKTGNAHSKVKNYRNHDFFEPSRFFKNSGFAGIFKFIGRSIVGTGFGMLIAPIIMAVLMPILRLPATLHAYFLKNHVGFRSLAHDVLGDRVTTGMQKTRTVTVAGSGVNLFRHKSEAAGYVHPYGYIRETQFYGARGVDPQASVTDTQLDAQHRLAYGRVR